MNDYTLIYTIFNHFSVKLLSKNEPDPSVSVDPAHSVGGLV